MPAENAQYRIWLTPLTVGLTAATTALQYFFPLFLDLFGRVPGALGRGEYWRLITPILFHDAGWRQIVFNLSSISIVGIFVERIFQPHRWKWLLVYLGAGFAGELAGFAWQPKGAGASVAGCGLLGTLAMWLLLAPRVQARAGGLIVLSGAAALTWIHDIHGPALLFGIIAGGAFLRSGRAPV